jgi:protein involved in polysaccharide export with SLBB domain
MALIDRADPEVNLKLRGGEEVRVPEAGRIFVVGNVKRPGAFAIEDNGQLTLLKALAHAEGLTRFASKHAFIFRREAAGTKNEIPVQLSEIMERKAPDVPLLPNDILYIPDNKRARLSVGTLEKLLLVGGGVTSALVYAGVR